MSKVFDSIEVSEEIKKFVDHSFDIVNQIHEILVDQGKTQRDLAVILNKKESEVSKWMQGTHNFTLKSITKIETALGKPIILTPRVAEGKFIETQMVPVLVHANKNRPLFLEVKERQTNWSNEKASFANKGIKAA
jgi:transcriptional regulator with XRE-family HTH domain